MSSPSDRRQQFLNDLRCILRRSTFEGPLSLAIFEEVAVRQEARVQELLQDLVEQFERNAASIDPAYFETEEFQTLLRQACERITRSHQRQKFRFATNLLTRGAIEGSSERCAFDEFVLSLLDQLSAAHFLALFAVENVGSSRGGAGPHSHFVRAEDVADSIGMSTTETQSVLDHLASLGLLFTRPGAARVGGAMVNINFAFSPTRSGLLLMSRVEENCGGDEEQAQPRGATDAEGPGLES